jgi:TPP-dependent indolepyruvate ferredoxin oxidoreductase alpha subunit
VKIAPALIAAFFLCQPAAAQETTALAIEGWNQSEADDGVVYFRCASQICAAGSVVSYKAQPHRTALALADFEHHHRALAEHNKGTPQIRDVHITEPKERTIEGVRVLQISREVDRSNGTTTYTIEARLIGTDKSFSLVSDSPKPEWTANNFDGFLRNLVIIAGLRNN